MEGGIGTLGEKSVHRFLKYHLEPDSRYHEQAVGRAVADILREGKITEIQTGSFTPLARKLPPLLEEYAVEVVYPIPHCKRIYRIDAAGEVSGGRRSPKTGQFCDCFYELPRIAGLIPHPHFSLRLMLLDVEEYRTTEPTRKVGRRRTDRVDRLPVAIVEELRLAAPADYLQLLPPLPDPFTAKELQKALHRTDRAVRAGLWALERIGVLRRCGKRGNAILYTACEEERR